MKKALVIIAVSIFVVSCGKTAEVKEVKTAYVDTSVLMKEYTEAKDLEAKYKGQAEEKGRQLQAEITRFKQDAASFQSQAQANGQAWAQQRGAELQKREQQLGYAQQALSQQLQQESGVEMDSLVSGVKKFIKEYGKKNGYSYIYGTGDAATVLYAEEKYDITKDIIKALNDKYKAAPKTEEKAPAKEGEEAKK
ncbi:MAG: OmpH family outer membrane protein [Flavobacterium circumlabens]|uniref:OmpH family outer membrane protein n=1 Tax=Flavobacterium circumlabens TaxID=2133765 RepID=A0A4Y7UIR7_9FLAO|nr:MULTISPECIES: OmpH family outer membrane protein [Flavobacterium]QSB27356.1 OmpH family outer membrane protein [Flavobacterium sp. CLA17]TCN61218.1 periplasmic chaperone for outer membrane proteins Skp [Flavobacterium circumlabens]TEB46317.1 OmpH family outer membrane protein [Flavobacterium circumlabens]